MKMMLFVSTGRCGTTRIAQILREHLPADYSVVHQVGFARLANVLGHLLYYTGGGEPLKRLLFRFITGRLSRNHPFITTDPLTAMIIPRELVASHDVCIVHLTRDPDSFSKSFFRLSRLRFKSFAAHNFVPLWQPGIWPLENLLSRGIFDKYKAVAGIKGDFFVARYAKNPHFTSLTMNEAFAGDALEKTVNGFFGTGIRIPTGDLATKANQTLD